MLAVEVSNDLLAEDPRGAAVIGAPALPLDARREGLRPRGRISPEQVTQKALLGYFLRPWHLGNLIKLAQVGRETAVHAQYFVLYERSNRQVVEDVDEVAPQLHRVPALALVKETVDP